MDDSQSSDIFSETSVSDLTTITIEKYDVRVSKIKAYARTCAGAKNDIHQEPFSVFLEDCRLCILQSLDLNNLLLEDANTEIDKLCNYLEDAACVLQILSNRVKTIIESVAITCSAANTLSTSTGNIILSVFTHCRDSECTYGNNLRTVEKQLKDLFRNCHELQLTYLMALEKHLIFDLTEKEDQDILVATLEINLKISDVVQALDIKTMAEQWKAYTMICEKYSSFLLEKNIFNTSSKLLASTIERNIQVALETSEEDKIVLRSLKVASFSIKILFQLCNIFKCSANNNYKNIIRLLLQISLCNSSYYEVSANKSSEFTALLKTHISTPAKILIDILINEESFLKLIFATESSELRDSELLGYMLLVVMITKALLKKDEPIDNTDEVIVFVFSLLPYCHKWFNIGLKFEHTSTEGETQYYGLYEHFILHTAALATTFSGPQYKRLESYLYEALLGTEYYSAIFASNLWVLLCRLSNDQLQLDVLLGLLNVYQKLEPHPLFGTSPQRIHLSHTIDKLFQTADEKDKMLIYKQFSVKNERHVGIWTVMKIRNLHNSVVKSVEKIICDKLTAYFDEVSNDNEDRLDNLIEHFKLASTCQFVERNSRIEDLLLRAWLKACPLCNNVLQRHLDGSSVWLFRYLEGLASFTECYLEKFERRKNLVKILYIISNILKTGNIETVHLLLKLFFKLASFQLENENDAIATLLTNTIKIILKEYEDLQQYMLSTMISNADINELILPLLENTKCISKRVVEYKNIIFNTEEWQKQLNSVADNKYIHKCMQPDLDIQESISMECIDINVQGLRKSQTNFDLGDIDSLFEESDGEEPKSKKAKLDFDVDNLIVRIESDVEQLCQSKENILSEYKGRIKCVCDKLRNIVS
ncbi:FIGNL1-interacting regulator of recombination and mitosis-like [Maniola hyperantus]|uniref:FIGNL1-interacting regulator of recombination and mitosis-like n=1 Tax=Aphantopus hyperantus TaxID=2795564 RepID=UPI0015688489|nr:uncharacterized protein C1orf112 homolog [Maniola hyperantus]